MTSLLRFFSHLFVPLCCLLAAGSLTAQEPTGLITDRPDQTESSAVVPQGTWQLEMGWTYTQDDESSVDAETWEVPGTLLRVGLSPRLELRLGWSGWIDEEVEANGRRVRTEGAGDVEVGLKFQLLEGVGKAPALALLASTSLPTGSDGIGSEDAEPSVALLVAHALTPKLNFGYNLGMRRVTGLEDDSFEGFYTAALGRPLGRHLGGFLEVFGDLPEEGSGSVSIDGGLTWLAAPRFQIDLFVGTGLSDEADDFFAGMGFSLRWPS